MDEELANLILALWLQNSEDNSRREGLGVGGDSNLELAIRLQQEGYDQAEPQIEIGILFKVMARLHRRIL